LSTQRVNLMNILKSKKGVAIENALLFMMIIFGLCFLVSFVAQIGHHQYRLDDTLIKNRVELDQIGENFVKGTISSGENVVVGNYQYTVSGGVLKVYHKNDDLNENVLLYVKVEGGNPTVWRYSQP